MPSVYLRCVLQLFESILLTLPRQASGGGGETAGDTVLELSADIVAKLPKNFNMEVVRHVVQIQSSLSQAFFFQFPVPIVESCDIGYESTYRQK